MHHDVARAGHGVGLHGTKRAHCERLAIDDKFLQEEYGRCDDDHDRRHCRREVCLITDLIDELRVYHDGHDVESFADEHRRAEIRHGVHEYHECTRENRRCDERHNNGEYFPNAAAPKTLCRLYERGVDIFHRARRIEIDERIELQRKDEQDTCKSVDRWELIAKRIVKPLCQHPAAPADEDPRVRTDEWRREERDDDADLHNVFSLDFVFRHEVRERRADEDGEHRYAERHGKAVDHRLVIIFALKEMYKMFQRKCSCLCILERGNEEREERIDEKKRKYSDGEDGDARPKIEPYFLLIHSEPHPSGGCGCRPL